jgi:hypothetical protein
MPGVRATAAAGHEDALHPALEDLEAGRDVAAAGDQHRLGLQDRLPEHLEPGLPQRAAGLHDVGDHVRDAQLDARLHGPVEPGHAGLDAALLEEGLHDADVRRGDAGAGELGQVGVPPRGTGEAEAAATEPELEGLLGLGAGVQQQVAAGDPDVEGALADVQRDVTRAQVEELDAVLLVDERQLLGVVALAVAGLAQDLGGGLGQRPLVGDGYSQEGHGWSFRGGRRRRRARCRWRA